MANTLSYLEPYSGKLEKSWEKDIESWMTQLSEEQEIKNVLSELAVITQRKPDFRKRSNCGECIRLIAHRTNKGNIEYCPELKVRYEYNY